MQWVKDEGISKAQTVCEHFFTSTYCTSTTAEWSPSRLFSSKSLITRSASGIGSGSPLLTKKLEIGDLVTKVKTQYKLCMFCT